MRKLSRVVFGFAVAALLSTAGCSGANDPTAPGLRPQADGNPVCVNVDGHWYCN